MSSLVTSETIRDVAVITVDNPPVNALSPEVQTKLEALVDAALAAPAIRGLVLAGANNTFIAGVDIKELQKLAQRKPTLLKELHPLLNRLEASTKPVVCALSGVTLGGGLELALACHYRMASPSARVGLPEVKLGLIPGAGGTQRLPRLIGASRAKEMIFTGQSVKGVEAVAIGLANRAVAPEQVLPEAMDLARRLAAGATAAALECPPGAYNIVDGNPSPQHLWLTAFARAAGAPAPPRVSEEEALRASGPDAVYYATRLRGASHEKARRELEFRPRPLEWI